MRVDLTDALHKDAKGPIVISEKGRNAFFAMKKKIVDVVSSKSLLYFPKWNRKLLLKLMLAAPLSVGGLVSMT